MHDFKSQSSWPRLLLDYGWDMNEIAKRKSQQIFDRLQRENPQLPKPEYLKQ